MKSFFSMFKESAGEMKNISCLTVTGMMMALSIVLRNLSVYITNDLRITFSFLGIMVIAMLYGPTVSIIANVGVDIIGYFLDGFKARDYNFGLLAVKIIIAAVYGVCLYKKVTGRSIIAAGAISRTIAVVFGNLILNSAVLYYCYTNPNFPFMSASEWNAFGIWFAPRVIKNAVMLPIEIAMISFLLPAVRMAYQRVFSGKIRPKFEK